MNSDLGLNLAEGFEPSRLRVARLRNGKTMKAFSEDSGVSIRSLSNFEKGQGAPPSPKTISSLAVALEVQPDFFNGEPLEVPTIGAVSFRKLTKTSAKQRDAALANSTLVIELFRLISERFVLPHAELPTFENVRPSDAAYRLRAEWGLGERPISNLLALLESKGIRVAAILPGQREIDAFCFERDGEKFILLNTGKSGERQRFDLAHELGHFILHSKDDLSTSESKEREKEANEFAAAFLMPAARVFAQNLRAATIDDIHEAKSYWKVSAMAMTHRLGELGLLSEWQYRNAMVQLSRAGYRSAEPGGIVPERSVMLPQVLYGKSTKLGLSEIAAQLKLPRKEVATWLNGLLPLVFEGGATGSPRELQESVTKRTGSGESSRLRLV
ncbi:ImmA/IrrE family metallo-endopeptidase [Corynebacterium sp. A21]|uniref:ImmA/IrrE family metallo-endopeptidase n=1 Tax=Corynebacterium sp. A21 TaxID=3457318 RepID=UPI003FD261A7